jgi:starvation-inducible DNA-binding protein
LGGTPENKYSGYLKVARIPEVSGVTSSHEAVDNILNTYKHFITEERKLIDLANEANDAVTADMLTGYLKEQEKMIWMLVAFSSRNCEHK